MEKYVIAITRMHSSRLRTSRPLPYRWGGVLPDRGHPRQIPPPGQGDTPLNRDPWKEIPSPMTTLYNGEYVHIAQTLTWIPTPYFCVGQGSDSECVPESESGKVHGVNESLV